MAEYTYRLRLETFNSGKIYTQDLFQKGSLLDPWFRTALHRLLDEEIANFKKLESGEQEPST